MLRELMARNVGQLPPGARLDPAIEQDHPFARWVINADGSRSAWNGDESTVICVVCRGDRERMPDCSECRGTGVVQHVPFCPRPWDKVIDRLWLGGHDCQPEGAPPNGDCIPADEFDLVVSLYRRHGFGPDEGVRHIFHRMADAELDPTHHSMIDSLAAQVYVAVRTGSKVLVRCQAGMNRSALVVGLVLVRLGWSVDDILSHLRQARSPYVLFNESFVDYLRAAEARRDAVLA